MNRFFQTFRTASPIIRFKIQGPITLKSQYQLTQKLNRIQDFKSQALLVVINSLGGSLQAAKNISARIKKLSINNRIPVYCFAEEYCLNSANLIFTTGTKCFAHKFSVVGDFGFVYEGLQTEEFEKKFNVKENNISPMKNEYRTSLLQSSITPTNKELLQRLLSESQAHLKEQILANRINSLSSEQQQSFIQKIQELDRNDGFCGIEKLHKVGMIDGIIGVEQYIFENYPKRKIIEGAGDEWENATVEWFRNLKQSLQYRDNK